LPLVSVIMPVYNGETYLAEAIESILTQTFADFEFVIVDDGSTDGSAAIIQDYGKSDERIRILRHRKNRGKAVARNSGIAAAEGEFIASMDCDDVSLPERIRKQLEFLQLNPQIGMVGVCGQVMNHDLTRVLYDFEVPVEHAQIALTMFVGYGFLGATVMFVREILSAVGGYEPSQLRCDDFELFPRLLHETPIRGANLRENLYFYRRHDRQLYRNLGGAEYVEERKVKKRNLELLWDEAPEATMDRLYQLRSGTKLTWAERQAAKRDLKRLIDAMIAHNWVEPEDKPLLINEMNRRLELASPRRWQQFCHWRRHRLGF